MEIDSGAAAPALSPGVAQRALFSLQEAAEVVLQFVEQTAGEREEEEEEEGSSGGTVGSLVRHALLVAALRVVARWGCLGGDARATAKHNTVCSSELRLFRIPAVPVLMHLLHSCTYRFLLMHYNPISLPSSLKVLRRSARSFWRPPAPAAAAPAAAPPEFRRRRWHGRCWRRWRGAA